MDNIRSLTTWANPNSELLSDHNALAVVFKKENGEKELILTANLQVPRKIQIMLDWLEQEQGEWRTLVYLRFNFPHYWVSSFPSFGTLKNELLKYNLQLVEITSVADPFFLKAKKASKKLDLNLLYIANKTVELTLTDGTKIKIEQIANQPVYLPIAQGMETRDNVILRSMMQNEILKHLLPESLQTPFMDGDKPEAALRVENKILFVQRRLTQAKIFENLINDLSSKDRRFTLCLQELGKDDEKQHKILEESFWRYLKSCCSYKFVLYISNFAKYNANTGMRFFAPAIIASHHYQLEELTPHELETFKDFEKDLYIRIAKDGRYKEFSQQPALPPLDDAETSKYQKNELSIFDNRAVCARIDKKTGERHVIFSAHGNYAAMQNSHEEKEFFGQLYFDILFKVASEYNILIAGDFNRRTKKESEGRIYSHALTNVAIKTSAHETLRSIDGTESCDGIIIPSSAGKMIGICKTDVEIETLFLST